MADTNKKEYTSNLHPKGDLDTTVYPNVKSENIIDKDTTAYTAGKVPDSSLVSKSLDGISENLETTKIQVATNKNNIETLQGNYTGLQHQVNTNSSDIALTKTQVETNKTNIAKNTQDIATNTQNIENLSAVTPNGINVDANGYAILEHDGTEITEQKKNISVISKTSTGRYSLYPIKNNEFAFELKNADKQQTITYTLFRLEGDPYSELITFYKDSSQSARFRIGYSTLSGFFVYEISYNELRIKWQATSSKEYILYYPKKSGTFALVEDLATKQSKLYRHTVKISKPTDDGKTSITFSTSSVNNTPIDSIQDLTTVFGNTDLSVSGATFLISSSQWEFYNKIHVGTSINDTTVDYINKDDVGTYNFTDMFGTAGFTITDNVTAM